MSRGLFVILLWLWKKKLEKKGMCFTRSLTHFWKKLLFFKHLFNTMSCCVHTTKCSSKTVSWRNKNICIVFNIVQFYWELIHNNDINFNIKKILLTVYLFSTQQAWLFSKVGNDLLHKIEQECLWRLSKIYCILYIVQKLIKILID